MDHRYSTPDFVHIPMVTLLRRKPRLRAVTHFGVQARALRPWMNAWRVPYEAHTSVVGYASEGSALRNMTKHVEEQRLRAVTHFGVQARASARRGSTYLLFYILFIPL